MKDFEEIYRKYYGHVLSIAQKYSTNIQDAEDILQETFISLYGDMQKRQKGDKEGYFNIRSWLSVVARNKALNQKRKVARIVLQEDIGLLMDCMEEMTDSAEDDYIKKMTGDQKKELCRYIMNEIKKRSTAQYKAVLDSWFLNMTSKEIAERNNVNTACIDARIYRARTITRRKFGAEYQKSKYA